MEILGSITCGCLLSEFSCGRIQVVEFIDSCAVAGEHQLVILGIEVFDSDRLRFKDGFPAVLSLKIVIYTDAVYSVTVV